MIAIVDNFTLCVVLGEEEDPVSLKVTAMKDEKVYHGIITGDMKPKKLQNQSGEEWLRFVYDVVREYALASTVMMGKDRHKISVTTTAPTSSTHAAGLQIKIVQSLDDGGENSKAQLILVEKLDKELAFRNTIHDLGFHPSIHSFIHS